MKHTLFWCHSKACNINLISDIPAILAQYSSGQVISLYSLQIGSVSQRMRPPWLIPCISVEKVNATICRSSRKLQSEKCKMAVLTLDTRYKIVSHICSRYHLLGIIQQRQTCTSQQLMQEDGAGENKQRAFRVILLSSTVLRGCKTSFLACFLGIKLQKKLHA